MNVRGAVAQVEQAAMEPAKVSPADVVRSAIEKQADAFRAVLPSVVDPERFSRLLLQAVKSTPDLLRCFETQQGGTSVLLAAMQAAAVGLEPNTPTQDAWLLPRRNRRDGTEVWEATLMIGYRGLIKLARRSGTIKTIYAEVVHERDHFKWGRGLEQDFLEHVPYQAEDRGDMTHAYAVARFMNGGYAFQVLNRFEVEKRRAMSDSWKNDRSRPYSPWTNWPAAMWRKSAVRALVPYLDLSAEAADVIERDDTPVALDTQATSASAPVFTVSAPTPGPAWTPRHVDELDALAASFDPPAGASAPAAPAGENSAGWGFPADQGDTVGGDGSPLPSSAAVSPVPTPDRSTVETRDDKLSTEPESVASAPVDGGTGADTGPPGAADEEDSGAGEAGENSPAAAPPPRMTAKTKSKLFALKAAAIRLPPGVTGQDADDYRRTRLQELTAALGRPAWASHNDISDETGQALVNALTEIRDGDLEVVPAVAGLTLVSTKDLR